MLLSPGTEVTFPSILISSQPIFFTSSPLLIFTRMFVCFYYKTAAVDSLVLLGTQLSKCKCSIPSHLAQYKSYQYNQRATVTLLPLLVTLSSRTFYLGFNNPSIVYSTLLYTPNTHEHICAHTHTHTLAHTTHRHTRTHTNPNLGISGKDTLERLVRNMKQSLWFIQM